MRARPPWHAGGERWSSAVIWGHLIPQNVLPALTFISCSHQSVVSSMVSFTHPLRSIPACGVVRALGRYDHITRWRFLNFSLRQKPGHIAFQPTAIHARHPPQGLVCERLRGCAESCQEKVGL